MIPSIRRRAEDSRGEGKAAEIRVDDDEIGKVLDNAFDDFVVVGFG